MNKNYCTHFLYIFIICVVGYVLDDFPCLSEENMNIKDQIELIKNWKLKPDFNINIKVCKNIF
jgi:hypothetical protein